MRNVVGRYTEEIRRGYREIILAEMQDTFVLERQRECCSKKLIRRYVYSSMSNEEEKDIQKLKKELC